MTKNLIQDEQKNDMTNFKEQVHKPIHDKLAAQISPTPTDNSQLISPKSRKNLYSNL